MTKTLTLLLFISLILIGCSEVNCFEGVKFRQYADQVIAFSSQYNTGQLNYSASKLLFREDVFDTTKTANGYGSNGKAWASLTDDNQREFLVLGFDTLQTVHTIEVYETSNVGSIDSVYIRNAGSQQWQLVYTKPAQTDLPDEARIFTVYIRETTFLVDAVRLALNSPEVAGWNEIDAIAISGQRK